MNPETLHTVTSWLDQRLVHDRHYLATDDHVLLSAPWAKAGYRYIAHDRVLVLYRSRTRTYVVMPTASVRRQRPSDLSEVRQAWEQAVEGSFAEVIAWCCQAWRFYSGFVGQPVLDHQSQQWDPDGFAVADEVAGLVREMILETGRDRVLECENTGEVVTETLRVRRGSRAERRIVRAADAFMKAWVRARPDEVFFPENVADTEFRYLMTLLDWLAVTYPDLVRREDDPLCALLPEITD